MTRRIRHRLGIALLAIACLLLQQAALAAYLCPVEQVPAAMTAMTGHCAGMDMPPPQDNPALCQKHCSPDHPVAADAVKLSVPPLALPALALEPLYVPPVSAIAIQADVAIARSDPPTRLRFCSILI